MLIRLFTVLSAYVCAVSAHNGKRMLGFVPGLYDAALDLSHNGYYEHNIEHVDVYGGYTKSNTVLKLRQDRFVQIDDSQLVSCTASDVYLRAARAPVFGQILIGPALDHCCALAAAAQDRAQANVVGAAEPMPFDMMLHSLCGREVRVVSLLDDVPATPDGQRVYRVGVADVDVMPLIDHLSVQFSHTPGNATEEEARHEMRRRGNFIDLDKTQTFDGIRWNYNETGDTAKSKDFEVPFTAFNGFPTVCNECFLSFAAKIDFTLLVTRTMWGLPKVQVIRVMFSGDLKLATRISVTVPFSKNLVQFSKDLAPRVEVGKLTIPAGPFGITLRASFGPVLSMGVTASAQVTVSHGSRTRIKTSFGFSWKAGQGLPNLLLDSETSNSYPGSTIGPFGVSPVQSKQLKFYVGVSMDLRVDVGLNWLPLAVIPLIPSPEFFTVSLGIGPRLQMLVKFHDDLKCLGYELQRGVSLGTTISAIFLKIGRWKIGFSQFLGFPFFGLVDIFKVTTPPDCAVCRGCLPAEDKLPPFLQKAVEVVTKNPDMMQVLMLPRVANISVSLNAANFTVGQNLTLSWTAPSSTDNVIFAVERKRKDDEYDPEKPTQYPLYSGVVPIKNGSFPLGLNRLLGQQSSVTFLARAVAPDMQSGDQLRIYVADTEREEVFGSTDWLTYVPINNMQGKTKYWLYSGWSDCIQECGPEKQTRDAFCVDETGKRVDGCDDKLKESLSRDCGNMVCAFVPLSIMEPAEGDTKKCEDNGNVKLNIQINGGLPGITYDVRLCADGAGTVSCDEPNFAQLRCVLVGQSTPGQRKEFSFALSQFKLERHKLRLLGAQLRVLASVAGEDILSPNYADRRSFSAVFTVAASRRYKLDTPDKVPQPKAFFIVGSAGATDGKNQDDQLDIGEIQTVWVSPEWIKLPNIGGTTLVISSPDPLLGGPDVPTEKLLLTFNTTTSLSTCAPHDGLLATGTPVCKASWTNEIQLQQCITRTEAPTPLMVDSASSTSATVGALALAAFSALV